MQDVHKRIVRSQNTGKIIDECIIDDVPDEILHRRMMAPEDIQVELIMKGATRMFETRGVDVAEVFSPLRIVQEAGLSNYDGLRLTPGWSLDLTRTDPKTGKQWDLANKTVQSRVKKMIRDRKHCS